jgi:hypothetical protein
MAVKFPALPYGGKIACLAMAVKVSAIPWR